MATTNPDLTKAVKSFRSLSPDDQIGALAGIYAQAAGSLQSTNVSASDSENVRKLIESLEDAYGDNPVQFLKDVLLERQDKLDEVALDPHPSKAMMELLPGSTKPPLKRYNDLSAHDRMAFWYQFAQKFSSSIPASFQPSESAQQVLQSLGGMEMQQQVEFLGQIL